MRYAEQKLGKDSPQIAINFGATFLSIRTFVI